MGRGLSQLQKDILDALPALTEGMSCSDAPTRGELVEILGRDATEANRVAVTRAVTRLQKRGLVLHVWGFHGGYQRTGYAMATPEQVAVRRAAWADFCSRHNSGVITA